MITRLIVGLILIMSSFFAVANSFNAESCKAQERKTYVVFSNGMFNKEADIQKSFTRMAAFTESIIKKYDLLDSDELVEYKRVINTNEFPLEQIDQVVSQRTTIEKNKVKNWATSYGEAPSWLEDHEKEAVVDKVVKSMNINIDDYETDPDLNFMIKFYEDLLKKGGRVLIFAHSQGNVYANLAVEHIIKKNPDYAKSIRIISIATPDIRVVNNGTHISAHEDKIINGVRSLYESTLPANVSFHINTKFYGMYHSFVDHYMTHTDSLAYIEEALRLSFDNLEYPKGNGTEIRFTLNKNGNPNIYLAVSEALYGVISVPSFVGPPIDPNLPFGSPQGTLITGKTQDTYTYPCGSLRGRSITLIAMVLNNGREEHDVTLLQTTPATPLDVIDKKMKVSEPFMYSKIGGFIISYDNNTNLYHVRD